MAWRRRLLLLALGTAALLGGVPRPESAQRQTLSGLFLVVWGDPRQRGLDHRVAYLLADDRGRQTELAIPADVLARVGGPSALDRRRVEVSGAVTGPGAATMGDAAPLAVDRVRLLPGPAGDVQALAVSGSRTVGGGGSLVLDNGGQPRAYAVAWLPPWAWRTHGVIAHEMGHGFGLPHSSGPYQETYDSRWDPMSNPGSTCTPADPTYGCVGVHTIATHKDRLGWIPPERKHTAGPGRRTLRLERLALPGGADPLLAVIPLRTGQGRFYTVEARQRAGYDIPVPGDAVIIHEVDPARFDRAARVVDPDADGDPNDEGAMWQPGEVFGDAANGVRVAVNRALPTGFEVTIEVEGPDLVVASVTGVPELPALVPPGGSFAVRDTTRNTGPLEAGPSTTRYRLSPDADLRTGYVALGGGREVPALAPGQGSTGRATVRVPLATPPGTYHVGACADAGRAVAEESEANNCRAAATIRVAAP